MSALDLNEENIEITAQDIVDYNNEKLYGPKSKSRLKTIKNRLNKSNSKSPVRQLLRSKSEAEMNLEIIKKVKSEESKIRPY